MKTPDCFACGGECRHPESAPLLRIDQVLLISWHAAILAIAFVLLALWCDADSRVQRLERVVGSIANSYPDGQFHEEIR